MSYMNVNDVMFFSLKDDITLDHRLQFPDSVGGIFPGPATTQGIEWFSQLGYND